MSYYDKGLALFELVLGISFLVVLVGGIIGTVHKLNLFHEIDSRIESNLIDFQADYQTLTSSECLSRFIKNITSPLAKTIRGQHTIGLNLVGYQGSVRSNQELIVGQISDLADSPANSIESLIVSQIVNTNHIFNELGYQQNKYLNTGQNNVMETKFMIVRLLVQPDKGLIKILEALGLTSKLYFEKIIKISK